MKTSSLLLRRQRGLTLVELMISMALGLIILTAISMLFVNHNRLQVELDKSNRLIDNGRYALELLAENLRLSGFYGEFDASGIPPPPAFPDPCATDLDDLRNGLGFHIQAYDAADTTSTAAPPASCGLATLMKPGSDVLVIRRVQTTSTVHSAIPVSGNTSVYLQASQCDSDTPTYKLDTDPANLDRLTLLCTTAKAPASRLVQEVYFVALNNDAGDGIPTLKKVELQADGTFSAPVPLVEGIEFLQFSYGLDTTVPTDGVPDSYSSCSANTCDTDWDDVVAVKIYALARNIDSTRDFTETRTFDLGPTDSGTNVTYTPAGADANYRRQVYVQTVRLPNPALPREVP